MAQYDSNSNYDSFNVGFAPVARRPIIRKNLDAFASAFDKIGNAHMEALKQRSAIDVALAQVELDSSEDEWKADYVQKIKDRIDNAAMFGSYSSALTVATKAAADAVSSPELLGRQRAHQDHKKALEEVRARQDVDDIIKELWEDKNQYYYEDKRDASGRIIGGTKWEQKESPAARVPLAGLAATAAQMVSEYQSGTSTQTDSSYTRADGSSRGGGSSSSVTIQSKSKERIAEMFNNVLDSDPQAVRYLNQLHEATIHKVEKLKKQIAESSGEEKTRLQNELAGYEVGIWNDKHTAYVTPREYAMKFVNPMIAQMAYKNVSTSRSSRSNISEAQDRGGGGGSSDKKKQAAFNQIYRMLTGNTYAGPQSLANPQNAAAALKAKEMAEGLDAEWLDLEVPEN